MLQVPRVVRVGWKVRLEMKIANGKLGDLHREIAR